MIGNEMKKIYKVLIKTSVIASALMLPNLASAKHVVTNTGHSFDVLDCKGDRYKDSSGWHDSPTGSKCIGINGDILGSSLSTSATVGDLLSKGRGDDGWYDDCVDRTWDHIGCWLQDTFGVINIDKDLEIVSPADRISRLEAQGVFAAQNKSSTSTSSLAGQYKQTCSESELLATVEKYKSGEIVISQCFTKIDDAGVAPARTTATPMRAAQPIQKLQRKN